MGINRKLMKLLTGMAMLASLLACASPSQTVETKNTVVVKENPNDKTIQKEHKKKAEAKKKNKDKESEKEPQATKADDNPEEVLMSQVEGNRLFEKSLMSDNLRKAVNKMQELTDFRLKDSKTIVVLTEETTESVRLQVFKRSDENSEKLIAVIALKYDITLDQLEGKEPGQKEYTVVKAKEEKEGQDKAQTNNADGNAQNENKDDGSLE